MSVYTGLGDLGAQIKETSRSIEASDNSFNTCLDGIEKSLKRALPKNITPRSIRQRPRRRERGTQGRGLPRPRELTRLYALRALKLARRWALATVLSPALGCEVIVSKRLGSTYRSGRSKEWIKIKNPAAPAVQREAQEEWR